MARSASQPRRQQQPEAQSTPWMSYGAAGPNAWHRRIFFLDDSAVVESISYKRRFPLVLTVGNICRSSGVIEATRAGM